MQKTIRKVHSAVRDDIADLITYRALPTPSLQHLDPFLFLNHHGLQTYPPRNRGLPFGPHPHRGFETVTFILEGDIAHRDSGGHESVINAGGVQWMTAGRGIVHEEVSSHKFKQEGGNMEILQLWVNLPSRLKMTDPKYIGLQKDSIPELDLINGQARLVSGTWKDQRGAFDPLTDVHLVVVELFENGAWTIEIPPEKSTFFYVVSGSIEVNSHKVGARSLVEFSAEGTHIDIRSVAGGCLLLGHGTPTSEPIVAHGPFVMNTREEIIQAIEDYQNGKF